MTYDIDKEYDLWSQEQADSLRNRAFDQLDIDNLIEELEALVRGEKSPVESLVYQILLHLLLINYWHEESQWNRNYWASEITGFRLQLNNKLTTNLKNHVLNRLDYLYQKAHKAAINKTKSSIKSALGKAEARTRSLSFRMYL
ncbi:protein of unknown function DUF29 [Stanieria cyanosphaera PCC 7437]|uniref:DUF29 domain-containing protein n=1 Tax=Stanieria cyanosphaera (strain ATCC 29371 / PCC 7437) TaxID=111780 RepID=K9XSX0_STAC7|nr:DUF29 domain-containing protein [Stanieria cyanosphaera]AFZ35628.1 protein of unknown function DUF29 [Stanieria cyanosphaera PCC 7437]